MLRSLPALLVALALSPAAGHAAERTWHILTTGNGHGFQTYDRQAGRVTGFLEAPYRYLAPPDERRDGGVGRRNLAHDLYLGVRVGDTTRWLNDLTNPSYEAQTHIITASARVGEVAVDVYYFAPFGLEANGMVMAIRARNESDAAQSVRFFGKPNLKLGRGRVDPDDAGETIEWTGRYGVETGPGGGHALYLPIGGVDGAGCGDDATLYQAALRRGEVGGQTRCSGTAQVLVMRRDAQLGPGEEAWWGEAVLFLNDTPSDPQAEDFRDHRSVEDILGAWADFAGDQGAGALHAAALAEFEAWRADRAPPELSATERRVWRQSEAVLRMGQIREARQPNRANRGMVLAALPVGEWHTGWTRDMAYSLVAYAMTGHTEEAKLGVEFYLGAQAGFFDDERYLGQPNGRPYRVSVCRYYGNGKEEGDFNFAGPNIETDGWGLALWAARMAVDYSCDLDWLDQPTAHGDTVLEGLLEIAEDVEGVTLNNLPAPECSIWETHWDWRQIFTYTAAAQIRGLLDFAAVADAYAARDPAYAAWADTATHYRDLALRMLDTSKRVLVHPRFDAFVSHQGVTGQDIFRDASAAEMLSWDLVSVEDPLFVGTLNEMQALVTGFGGYRRLEPGLSLVGEAGATQYDLSEWTLLDLRIGEAWRRVGEVARADALLDKITDAAAANDGLIPELFEPNRGNYTGVVPMVGYGAGAWMMAQLEKHGRRAPAPLLTLNHCVQDPGRPGDPGVPSVPSDPGAPDGPGTTPDAGLSGVPGGGPTSSPGGGPSGSPGAAPAGPTAEDPTRWQDGRASLCSTRPGRPTAPGWALLILVAGLVRPRRR